MEGDFGKDQSFALKWMLSGSRGNSMIGYFENDLEGRKNEARLRL